MSGYSNGQPSYNYYSTQSNQYGQPPGSQQDLQRTQSFSAGDDARLYEQAQNSSQTGHTTFGLGTLNVQSQQPAYPSASQAQNVLQYRTEPQGHGLSGYQHQYQSNTAGNVAYNPAQYQPHQSPYSPQPYGSPQQPSSSGNTYQPYVPSAYQGTMANRQPSLHNNYYYNSAPQSVQAPPPVPPRPSELAYTSQTSAFASYSYDSPSAHPATQQSSHGFGYAPSMSSPSIPPPPPPPPHHDSYTSARPYAHSSSATHDPYNTQIYGSTLSAGRSPEIHRNYSSASHASQVSNQSSSFLPSPQSPAPTPPSRTISHNSPQRPSTSDRHPRGSLLPGVPSESESDSDYFIPHSSTSTGRTGIEDLMNNLDAAIGGDIVLDPLFGRQGSTLSPDERPTHVNGVMSSGGHVVNYGAFENDSDAEAAAGLAALQAADQQEAAEESRRRSTQTFTQAHHASTGYSSHELSEDSDYAGYDLSLAGGGYAGTMSYGKDDVSPYAAAAVAMPEADYNRLNPRMASVRSAGLSSDGRTSQTSGFESIPDGDSVHPFPAARSDVARVDTGGTGGLTEPSSAHNRRLSFEENDEADLTQQFESPRHESIPDLFFHPGMSTSRPLPPPPSQSDPVSRIPHSVNAGTSPHQNRYDQYNQPTQTYPVGPEVYQNRSDSPSLVPRSASLVSSRSQKPEQPIRSKTDSDRAKLQRQSVRPFNDVFEINPAQGAVALDLPVIPRKRFNASKISAEQYKKCTEPWSMSSILTWVRDLANEESDLKEHALVEAITSLFMNKVPTMNSTEAESLGERVVEQMLKDNALIKEEEWVKFSTGQMSGVLYQLTGTGCYSSRLHLQESKGRCYSYHCMRTLKKVDLTLPSEVKSEDWVTYYKLTKADIEKYDKKEIERQNILHEIVSGEDKFIRDLDVLRLLYRDQIENAQPPIIIRKLSSFIRHVFGGVDKIKKVNEDFLLSRLKYRQNEQGPFVVGFSDIFREWIRRARPVFAEYAQNYPQADYLVRKEVGQNREFANFLERCRADPRSNRLDWSSYLKGPIQRIQRYGLLLDTILKNSIKDTDEKANLLFAINEVKAATHEANQKLAEAEKKMDLVELAAKLKLRKQMEVVELNLDHLGRKVIMRGDLQRAGGRGFQMVDTHAILFDHYLVLAKIMTDARGSLPASTTYDVSKSPIPMDLVSLESTNDAAVVKSSVKGIATVTTTVTPRSQAPTDTRLARTTSTNSGGTMPHTNTGLSGSTAGTSVSLVPSTTIEPLGSKDDKVLYPFKVKHLGKAEVYTLYATSADQRDQWCQAIISAKQDHAEALYTQNAEPFKLRVLADTAFGMESYLMRDKGVFIRDTPLYRAIRESEEKYIGSNRPAPICRKSVNCATVFQQPYGRHMCAIGTDYGVYISEYGNSRGWIRAVQMTNVTQIAVLEEFNLFLLISDKVLIAYHLDVVCPASGPVTPSNDALMRKAPQKLSGSKEVSFFISGKMKDRALVFYKKKDGSNSVFKVLEPVLQKSATTRSRFLPTTSRRGQTDFFREYDEFYIPTDCYSINLFHSSLAVSTFRGVEVLTLDKKQPWTVPNLRSDQAETQAHLSSIASRIKDLRPLGMFRLSQSEFLVTFEECAVYVNQHGDISRGVVMEFVGRAKTACLHEQYLILCDEDFVEIRDAQNGRLKQVIAGKEMKMLDDGGNLMPGSGLTTLNSNGLAAVAAAAAGNNQTLPAPPPKTVKLCMQHPEHEKSFIVVELIFETEKV